MPKNLTEQSNTFFAPDGEAWRAWLAEHSQRESEVWLIFYSLQGPKKDQACIGYEEAVEEALCFGWIDSLIQNIDEQRYARKFTVRKDYATWSETNRRRLRKLRREGRLPEGLIARIPPEVFDASIPGPRRPDPAMPDWLEAALRASPAAWQTFQRLAPSQRRNYLGWILSARRQETRERRVAEAIQRLEQGLELGMK